VTFLIAWCHKTKYDSKKLLKMEKTKVDLMKEHLVKLEDILNSQQSLIEKVGVLTIDMLECPHPKLENSLNEINSKFSQNYDYIKEVMEKYEMEVNSEE